jgi:hypothetical protein
MTWVLIVVAGWVLLAIVCALLVGRAIALADRRSGRSGTVVSANFVVDHEASAGADPAPVADAPPALPEAVAEPAQEPAAEARPESRPDSRPDAMPAADDRGSSDPSTIPSIPSARPPLPKPPVPRPASSPLPRSTAAPGQREVG